MRLILASQSPYRRAQLENFGLNFVARSPLVDETALKSQGPKDLVELTRFLAQKKAESLLNEFKADVILGSDQLAEVDGKRLDKPGSFEKAKIQLGTLSGREHRLITSLAVAFKGEIKIYTDIARIRMRELTDQQIESYLNLDQPFDCAGSYKIEKAGLSLVQVLHSEDPSAIQGLPMLSLMRAFDDYGINVAKFWEKK